jgi:DNA-binding transcriptional ArsR family regulator
MTSQGQGGPQLARLAALLADSTRATFCLALLDGRAWTAGELARHAGVAPSTATDHLNQLVEGGLLAQERQGRHRYVRLADPQVAQLVEDLAAHAAPAVPAPTLRSVTANAAMARARTCYDHLAGRLAILITDVMIQRGLLQRETGFAVTDDGMAWFRTQGIDLAAVPAGRRLLARSCLDWTERRPHLAGVAGAALCQHVLDRGWCVRIGSQRALQITGAGRQALGAVFGISSDQLDGMTTV